MIRAPFVLRSAEDLGVGERTLCFLNSKGPVIANSRENATDLVNSDFYSTTFRLFSIFETE